MGKACRLLTVGEDGRIIGKLNHFTKFSNILVELLNKVEWNQFQSFLTEMPDIVCLKESRTHTTGGVAFVDATVAL